MCTLSNDQLPFRKEKYSRFIETLYSMVNESLVQRPVLPLMQSVQEFDGQVIGVRVLNRAAVSSLACKSTEWSWNK